VSESLQTALLQAGYGWHTADRELTTVDEVLADARSGLRRLEPAQAHVALSEGAHLIDIRSESQRAADGVIPGARFVPRNVLEWRLDPESPHRDPEVARPGARVVVMCNEGYQSSLAAATLQSFGLAEVMDVIGGFQAWRGAGLPVEPLETIDE
jgi:rhodanese-related sulfurtransferase